LSPLAEVSLILAKEYLSLSWQVLPELVEQITALGSGLLKVMSNWFLLLPLLLEKSVQVSLLVTHIPVIFDPAFI
jgi:hypothetical protein